MLTLSFFYLIYCLNVARTYLHKSEDILAHAACDICARSIAMNILQLRTTPDPYAFDSSEPMGSNLWAMCVCRMLSSLATSALLLPPHTLGKTMPLFLPVLSSPISVSLQTIDQQVRSQDVCHHKLKLIHRFSDRTHSSLSNYPLYRLFFILRTTVLQFLTVLFPPRRLATARRATTPGHSPPSSHIYRNKARSRLPRYLSCLPVRRCTLLARCPGGSPSRRWCVSARCR